jgi:hypothetical protein
MILDPEADGLVFDVAQMVPAVTPTIDVPTAVPATLVRQAAPRAASVGRNGG